ncbi:MAG TPA: zinc-ribbon domain-containing protein [Polyangium sp.]|nr:zinc-ribbon domain-containing protein [Polyangium sp.]
MKITCQSCQSKYTVSDEKVQGKTVKIKCRKCGATILVNSSGATTTNASDPAVAAADAAAAADGPTYLVNVADGDQRSMSLQELVQAVNASTITRDTYVWADGMADWQPLTQVQPIVDALNASGGGAATPEPARPAAKREGGRGASRDLFGGDAQSDAPLFSAPKAPAPVKIGAGTEEQSALFSLSALTSRVGSSPSSTASSGPSLSALASSSSSSKPINTEDSGLIDLKALAASVAATKESAASSSASLLDDPGGLFQMSGPSMTTATAAPTVSTPEPVKPQKNRTPMYIGIGAVLAVGAMIGVFVIASGSPPPADTPAQTSPTAANTPPPLDTAPPTATTAPPVDTAAAASASALAANTKTPTKGVGGGKTPTKTTGPTTGPGPGPAPAPAPAPKSGGGCGCAPSDLMCNMRCSAKKK